MRTINYNQYMNARNYRVEVSLSTLDFPTINGLGKSSILPTTESAVVVNGKLVLKISNVLFLTDVYNKSEHQILKLQSKYEIPVNDIKSSDDVFEVYKDVTLSLSEAYQFAQKQEPTLPNITFPIQSIKTYQSNIDSVFNLINSLN